MLNVLFLGLVSFFIDLSTHMIYPLVPLFLVSLGATPILIGTIEGVAESAASLLKVFSGHITDRIQRKKWLAFAGYVPALVYKIVLLVATTWVGVFAAKMIDRIGKGIRTTPRDVLIAESGGKKKLGGAFGLHKMLDMLGVGAGILLAFFIMRSVGEDFDGFRRIFAIAIIPSVLGLAMFAFIREKKEPREIKTREPFWQNIRQIDGRLKLYLVVVFLFTLGNSSNVFLLLRAQNIGFTASGVILLYFLYSITTSLLALPMGKLSDRIGRRGLLVCGYFLFALCYIGFAFVTQRWMVVAVFVLYGMYTAFISGAEKAYVVDIAPPELKGTMLGLQATIAGVALLPASIIAGVLWERIDPAATFIFGASMALFAGIILFAGALPLWKKGEKPNGK